MCPFRQNNTWYSSSKDIIKNKLAPSKHSYFIYKKTTQKQLSLLASRSKLTFNTRTQIDASRVQLLQPYSLLPVSRIQLHDHGAQLYVCPDQCRRNMQHRQPIRSKQILIMYILFMFLITTLLLYYFHEILNQTFKEIVLGFHKMFSENS